MKKLLYTLTLTINLMTGTAHAGYECLNAALGSTLKVKAGPTRLGDILVTVTSPGGTKNFHGVVKTEQSNVLMKRTTISLHPFQGDLLTVVTLPPRCGRIECDSEGSQRVHATLQVNGSEALFSCHAVL